MPLLIGAQMPDASQPGADFNAKEYKESDECKKVLVAHGYKIQTSPEADADDDTVVVYCLKPN